MKYVLFLVSVICVFGFNIPDVFADRVWGSGWELGSEGSGHEWDSVTGAGQSIESTIKRSGNYSMKATSTVGEGRFHDQDIPSAEAISRECLYIDTTGDAKVAILQHVNTGNERASVILNTNRTLTLHSGNKDATQIGSASSALLEDTWYCIELLSDEGATIEIEARLNGEVFAGGTTATVQTITEVRVGIMDWANNYTIFFDDVAVNNTARSVQNSYPGLGKMVVMQPDGTVGDLAEQSAGNCTSVNEVTPDDAGTTATLDADNDDFDCQLESALSAGIDSFYKIIVVSPGYREAAFVALSESKQIGIKSAPGGTVTMGATTVNASTGYFSNGQNTPRVYGVNSVTDPTTGIAWTPTGTNSLDNAQIRMTAINATPDILVTTMWLLVEYTDGSLPKIVIRGGSQIIRGGNLIIR